VNGSGPVRRDANGANGPIKVGGKSYAKGLGVYPRSDIVYDLAGDYVRFRADVGIDDACGGSGTVVFNVYLDGTRVYTTNKITGATATRVIDLNTSGKTTLRLELTDAGDGRSCEYADWADARLTRA
jgi:hypothetical protein